MRVLWTAVPTVRRPVFLVTDPLADGSHVQEQTDGRGRELDAVFD